MATCLCSWASFGGGRGGTFAPPPPTFLAVQGTEYLMSPHFSGWKKKYHVFQYLFVFNGHFYWTYPDDMFSLSTYIQIILSMYSIQRMRGNRNQSMNTVKREIFAAIKFCNFDHKAILVRFNFAGFPLLYVEHICGQFNFVMRNMSKTCKFQYIFQKKYSLYMDGGALH